MQLGKGGVSCLMQINHLSFVESLVTAIRLYIKLMFTVMAFPIIVSALQLASYNVQA